MHQIAMNLFKTFHKSSYFNWAIASLVLHHEHFIGPLEFSSSLSFDLAERMIDKYLLDQRTRNDDAQDNGPLLDLYIQLMIRSHTSKWGKVLDIFKSKGYPPSDISTWKWDDNHHKYCLVMEQAGLRSELWKYLQELYLEHKEFALLKQIVDIFGKDGEICGQVTEFMDDLRQNHEGFEVALGNIYFTTQDEKRFVQVKESGRIGKDLEMAITFGMDKLNFFPDTFKYFDLVDLQTQRKLLGIIAPPSAQDNESIEGVILKMSRDELFNDINYELTEWKVMGKAFDLCQCVKKANLCFGKYMISKLHGNKFDDRENKSSVSEDGIGFLDQYVLIAANILSSEHFKLAKSGATKQLLQKMFRWIIETETDYDYDEDPSAAKDPKKLEKEYQDHLLIMSAICMMKYGLTWSPENDAFRFMLANYYAIVGNLRKMFRILREAEISHNQLDRLGYLVFPVLVTCGDYPDVLRTLRHWESIYLNAYVKVS